MKNMDIDHVSPYIEAERIKDCEVCGKNEAKYTCPRCEVKTCCLECVKIHKKELDCNGIRSKVKFKCLKNFDNFDLLSDYRLLEETSRVVNKAVRLPAKSCYNDRSGTLPTELYRLKCTARSRGVNLEFLPPSFSRRQANTTFLDHETQNLYWRIDWVFPQGGKLSITDEKVVDSTLLSACVHKYLHPSEESHPCLSFYQSAGPSGITLLLKAEKNTPNRYFLLEPTMTLRENLYGKTIIENPMIYVVLNHHIDMFSVIGEEEQNALRQRVRRQNYRKNKQNFKTNFLFPSNNEQEDIEINGDKSNLEDPLVNNNKDPDNVYKEHRNFPYPRRGRGRGNSFRGRRNQRIRRHRDFNNRNSRNNYIDSNLSNNLGSVHIDS